MAPHLRTTTDLRSLTGRPRGHATRMGGLWFVVAALCVTAGVLMLWMDRRRRARAVAAPAPEPAEEPVDLFQESSPSDRP